MPIVKPPSREECLAGSLGNTTSGPAAVTARGDSSSATESSMVKSWQSQIRSSPQDGELGEDSHVNAGSALTNLNHTIINHIQGWMIGGGV